MILLKPGDFELRRQQPILNPLRTMTRHRVLHTATLFLAAFAPVLIGPAARAAEPLTWKWAEGDSVRYQLTQTMRMSMNAGAAGQIANTTRNDTVMRWSFDSFNDDGDAKVTQATERVVMVNKNPSGNGFKYDSQDEEPPAGMAALIAPVFEAMVESPFVMTMKPTGEITNVELSDELAEAFDRLPGGAVSGELVTQMAQQGALRFPEEPLAVGDEWTNKMEVSMPQFGAMEVLTTYVYDGPREVDGHEYEAFTASIEFGEIDNSEAGMQVTIETRDSTGEVLFDRQAGRVFRSRVLQTMAIHVTVGDHDVVNVVEQTVDMRQLGEDEEPTISTEPEKSLSDTAADVN